MNHVLRCVAGRGARGPVCGVGPAYALRRLPVGIVGVLAIASPSSQPAFLGLDHPLHASELGVGPVGKRGDPKRRRVPGCARQRV